MALLGGQLAAEHSAAGLGQRGGYECSTSGACLCHQAAGRFELPRRLRRGGRSLIVCMARGATPTGCTDNSQHRPCQAVPLFARGRDLSERRGPVTSAQLEARS